MKYDHAWTLPGQPRGETPAPPPAKRTPVLPRLPARRALFRQTGMRIFRTGRRQHLAFGEHVLGPGVPYIAARPRRHNPWPSYPPPSHKARLGNICTGQRLSHDAPGSLAGPDWAASPQPARFLGAFRNWFGFLERRVATKGDCNLRRCWRKPATNHPSTSFRSNECLAAAIPS